MKTFRTTRGPFAERPHFEEKEVEAICLDELTKGGLLPSTPTTIRIERFIEKRFGVCVEPADLKDGVLGFTEFGANGVSGVYVSRALDEDKSKPAQRRVRSTIAHEAGHGLLHTYLFVLKGSAKLFGDFSNPDSPKVLCREDVVESTAARSYSGEWWEFQANMAMGHLLMPKPLVDQAVQPYLSRVGTFGLTAIATGQLEKAIRNLAEVFDVNPALARIRLEKRYAAKNDGQLTL